MIAWKRVLMLWSGALSIPIVLMTGYVAAAQPATSARFIHILTATTGGVFYPLGRELSRIFAVKIPGSKPSMQATKGSVENLNLLMQRKAEIAFVQADSVAFAWAGNAEAGFKTKFKDLRAIAAIYTSYVQIVATQESGIKSLNDLKGKRMSVGGKRSGTELTTRALLKAAGIRYEDLAKVEYLGFAESVYLMKNREIDATLQTAGLRVPALNEITENFPIVMVSIPQEVVARVGAPYIPAVIPKGTYRGQDTDVEAAGLPNYLVTRADVPADLVYEMTKAVFDSTAELAAAHPAAASIKLERALDGMPIPLHPGAEKFFKEKGMIR